MSNQLEIMSQKILNPIRHGEVPPVGLLSELRTPSVNSKRAASKKAAIVQEGVRQAKLSADTLKKIDELNSPFSSMVAYTALGTLAAQGIAKLSAMASIPHWCFRKNRPELEPRLYNHWLKSQTRVNN